MGNFSNDLEVEYAEDATSMETTVEVVDPETGESKSCTWDNLTSAMYFIVLNDLKPEREGLRDLVTFSKDMDDATKLGSSMLKGMTPTEVLNAFRMNYNLPIGLYIQCQGDPSLVDELD